MDLPPMTLHFCKFIFKNKEYNMLAKGGFYQLCTLEEIKEMRDQLNKILRSPINNKDIDEYNEKLFSHLNNPTINTYHNEKQISIGYIYIFKSKIGYKIGTTKNVESRMKAIQTASGMPIEKIFSAKVENNFMVEKELHEEFNEQKIYGEWFSLSQFDIEFIKNYIESIGEIE
jgi:hypothetical protein